MAWSSPGLSLKGQRGSQIIYTNGAPKAADGFDGDGAIDVTNGRLYAQKSNGAWPTTYASLIGPQGGSVRVGSGPPTSSNPTTQNDTDVYVDVSPTNGPVLYGPRVNGVWPTSGTSLAGVAGLSVLSGTSSPTANDGVVGQPAFLNTATGQLYGPKTSSGWPSTPFSLVGPKGSQFYADTAPPGLQLGTIGDFFFQSNTYQLYQKITNAAAATTADYPNGWKSLAVIKGDAGIAGKDGVSPPGLYYGTANPGTVTGAQVGSFYINTTSTTLFGPLASGGWPSSGITLIGAAGVQQPGIYNNSGLPSTTTAPGAVNGSYYIRTDVTPLTLYGPLANGVWPTTGVSMSGTQIYTAASSPPAATGNIGDLFIDTTAGATKLYPAKTSSGWTASPVTLTGKTGDTGAAGAAGYSQLTTQASILGGQAGTTNTTLSSTLAAVTAYGMPLQYNPQQSSALTGLSFNNSGAALKLVLQNLTTGQAAYTLNVAAQSNNILSFGLTDYVLAAGNVYQWMISGSGTAQFILNPTYLSPSASQTNAVSTLSGFITAPSTAFSSTIIYSLFGTNTSLGLSKVWAPYRAGAVFGWQATYVPSAANAASATVTATLYLYNRSANSTSTIGSFAVSNTGLAQTGFLNNLPLPTTSTLYIGFTGSGTGQVAVELQVIV